MPARSQVAIVHEHAIGTAVPRALDLLGDMGGLFRDKHVAIKPNDTWASRNDRTACTRGDTVEALIAYVKRFSPRKITVTGGAGAAETDMVFRLMGIDRIIRKEGAEFFDHNRPPFREVELSFGPQPSVMVNSHVFEYDTLISLAQHKVHDDATVTLTMKNVAMSYPAADYYGHPRTSCRHPHAIFQDLHGFIAGMCHRFPIRLGIIVGHPAMIGQGPIGGRVFESGITIAGTDFVAVDSVGARLLGYDSVKHIEEAARLGLGNADTGKMEFPCLDLAAADRIFREASKRIFESARK